MKNLNLQPDDQGLLHCCGRMDKAQLPELTKKPLYIAAETPLAACIIKEAHLPLHRSTSHTLAAARQNVSDSKYLPPKELIQLRTRRQVIDALDSTHKLTEKFWTIWQKEYLCNLRESHKWHMDSKCSGSSAPTIDTVVLLADDNQPRNSWKMGRISPLKTSRDNAVGEAEVTLSNGHILRRPVSLLVPLEIDDSLQTAHLESQVDETENDASPKLYELRNRARVDYSEDHNNSVDHL
ncbi:unnamed protein product [Heligmosomoides polygyrus]|uniref:DUF5641 domain-containing protein n=1 Tax=Heligmosomoides polygyrus TaxID=6339 RepID=A0A183GXC4_HELPZ|nr:unnamed protein product [Heligmosomoides polygyrus]